MKIKGPDTDSYRKNKKIHFEDNTIKKIGKNIVWALKTPLGSRPNLPEFGSKLPWLLFELMDDSFFDLAKVFIIECVSKCEPRAVLRKIENISTTDDRRNRIIKIRIEYEVVDTVGKGTVVVDYKM